MQTALINRIRERRTKCSGVLQYLHSGVKDSDNPVFSIPSEANIKKFIKNFITTFKCQEELETLSEESENEKE